MDGEAPRANNWETVSSSMPEWTRGGRTVLSQSRRGWSCAEGPHDRTCLATEEYNTTRTVAGQGGNEDSKHPDLSLSVLRFSGSASPWLNPAKQGGQATTGYTVGRDQSPRTTQGKEG